MDTKIVKPSEANIFLEGVEVCREYFHTEKITFGTSELQPGQTRLTMGTRIRTKCFMWQRAMYSSDAGISFTISEKAMLRLSLLASLTS